ncbi:cleavage factor protein [Fomitiporia mediterranea MF3/22]|uniref:cleavage factor protein n=1 Tax=Fomitiporia mediterranea (strain MF3/22) TaxID=694068 RepID=UPI0004407A4B|nr:cleavage factor protein [Fomitiporia mediterranea MF3/22]EJD05583.1 cleavage factor protein [Fomitiporia mediterranea MF3/22]
MQALRSEILPPSGVQFATSLKLLPSLVMRSRLDPYGSSRKFVCNIVVAHSHLLRIFEVVEEPVSPQLQASQSTGRDGWSRVRKDTEAVEGEVEMDTQGEGFVNMASKPLSMTTYQFHFIREHRLHGIVTGLEPVKILSSTEDSLDRLLVSFKDAKLALLEWSPELHDLVTVSIHTYERAPQMTFLDPSKFTGQLRVDPLSRCAALSLPCDCLAILPFYHSQVDLDLVDADQTVSRDIPYSPSFILDLFNQVDHRIRNVIDFAFLPGFNNPTLAVLFQTQHTWTGRLKEFKDTCNLFIFTLDLVTHMYPIITSVENLPHDCFAMLPCDSSLGGVVIISCNSLIYVDQASRKTVLPVNGWAARVSDMPMQQLRPEEMNRDLHLEGAHATFVDSRTFFIITRDGLVLPVEIVMDGRTALRLALHPAMSQTTTPALVRNVAFRSASGDQAPRSQILFVGSTVGPSVLLRVTWVEEEIQKDKQQGDIPAAVADNPMAVDFDDEDDIYGDVAKETQTTHGQPTAASQAAVETKSVIHLSLCDSLSAYGPINSMAFALTRNGDRPTAELVAATGYARLGGFTLFQRDVPTRSKRKLHAVGGARGIWCIPVRQSLKVNGSERSRNLLPGSSEVVDTVIVSTDANPSPGLTRFAAKSSRNDIAITARRTETTIGAAPFFQRTAIIHVTTDLIRVLEPDCSERQCIRDMDGSNKRPKIRFCCISDPFILVIREDESLGLFVGDAERGRIRRKDMTPMGEKVSRYSAGCFFLDQSGIFELHMSESSPTTGTSDDKQRMGTGSLESAVDAQRGTQWLVLCRPQGVVEIWTLPKLALVFSTSSLKDLPSVVSDSFDPPALSLPEDPPRKPQEADIELLQFAQIGELYPHPHLIVMLRCGQLAIYQAVAVDKDDFPESTVRTSTLKIKFIKMGTRSFEPRQLEPAEKSSVIAEQRRALRSLVPFIVSPNSEKRVSGVFVTGDEPCWIVATDKDGLKIHSCSFQTVNSFTSCSVWDSKCDFLMHTDEAFGPCLLGWIPEFNLGTDMPSKTVTVGRTYTNVTFDAASGLMVASSVVPNPFTIFDEEGNKLWEPDAPNINYPHSVMSALELFHSDLSCVMDGYEFQPNEFVTALDCVQLETQSTESGTKEFIVVGTTVNRGEDLAVKGVTYVFEIVEIVPDPEGGLARQFKLRLLCKDEAKGPVTALCGMNGYLVSSMGQKIFVRALDLDERLVGVAFLDVGVYVTSLRTIKNLLIIGDAVKSVWLVAFQEDPFKLVIVAKEVQRLDVMTADFLFASDGDFYIAVSDEEGIIRLLEYDTSDPESHSGQYLLRRTEYHAQVESHTTVLIARRSQNDGLVPQARLISAAVDGSMYALTPVDADESAKRLQLLQGQLTRNMQHVAGLNPRAFRAVRSDGVARPLTKGILDGNLLAGFEQLPIPRQNEIARPIGTDRLAVLRDRRELSGPW